MTSDDQHSGEDPGVLASLPKGARWLPIPLFALIAVLVEGLLPDYMGGDHWSLSGGGVVAVLLVACACVAVAAIQVRRARLGGPEQARLFRDALNEGRVPEGADRGSWATEVTRRLEGLDGPRGQLMTQPSRDERVRRLRILAEQL